MENITETQHVFHTNTTDSHNTTAHSPDGHASANGSFAAMANLLTPAVNNPYLQDSLRFLFFGSILETGRRLWQWIMDRFTGSFVLKAVFDEGDPSYEWISDLLNANKVWGRSREFRVTARTSVRRWGVSSGSEENEGHAEYVPAYDAPQLFWYKGTCIQVGRYKSSQPGHGHDYDGGCISMTLYTRKKEVLDDLVEEARKKYVTKEKPRITVHTTDHCGSWCQTTTKPRRPLDSLILPTGMKEMVLGDAHDFLRSEAWYAEAGIQHKRGYLLYGAPGTGKSSTIHALAGELELEIYSLSLATNGLDDSVIAKLVSSTPAHSIILIEDIDCAFPSREQKEAEEKAKKEGALVAESKSNVTLSGLLNIIDGVSSEEGRLLFATTNHVDRLDPALLRPGRMDVKVHYTFATKDQITSLFKRFFPTTIPLPPQMSSTSISSDKSIVSEASKSSAAAGDAEKEKADNLLTPTPSPAPAAAEPVSSDVSSEKISDLGSTQPPTTENTSVPATNTPETKKSPGGLEMTPIYPPRLPPNVVEDLARQFAETVPEHKYTVAELQGYLLTMKTRPFEAVRAVKQWIVDTDEEKERMKRKTEEEKKEKEEKERKEKEKEKEKEEKSQAKEKKKEKKKDKQKMPNPSPPAPSSVAPSSVPSSPVPTTIEIAKDANKSAVDAPTDSVKPAESATDPSSTAEETDSSSGSSDSSSEGSDYVEVPKSADQAAAPKEDKSTFTEE